MFRVFGFGEFRVSCGYELDSLRGSWCLLCLGFQSFQVLGFRANGALNHGALVTRAFWVVRINAGLVRGMPKTHRMKLAILQVLLDSRE